MAGARAGPLWATSARVVHRSASDWRSTLWRTIDFHLDAKTVPRPLPGDAYRPRLKHHSRTVRSGLLSPELGTLG